MIQQISPNVKQIFKEEPYMNTMLIILCLSVVMYALDRVEFYLTH